jgi:hypothetical protein
MKRQLSALSIALIAIVLGSVILFSAGEEPRAAEIQPIDWDGDPSHVNVMGFLCDMEKMEGLLDDSENARVCLVNAVATHEVTQKLVIQRMLKSGKVRGMIMDKIASTPALRTQMEEKLAAAK